MEKEVKILNGTFEVALRLLAIMTTCKKAMTVERLTAYSYFALYLSDLDKEESSLHPEIPYRNSGYINSREVILPAIDMLLSKGVASCDYSSHSVTFAATELGIALYRQIQGTYKAKLEESIRKAHELMKRKSDKNLNDFIYGRLAEWGSEFGYESVLKELEYDE